MEALLAASWFMPVVAGVIGLIVLILVFMSIYKVAEPNKALVITGFGCKKPKVKVSGGALVIPILQKARFFPLDIMTITEAGDEVRTNKAVPIVIKWTAQVAVQTIDTESLAKTIRLFIDKGVEGMKESVKYTIQANVREIISSMTPEAVLTDKAEFVENVKTATQPDLNELGLKLSTLNINDVCDQIGYYDNMATAQVEAKRREAEVAKAEAERDIREKQAEANRIIREKEAEANRVAKEKELAAEILIAEKTRDNNVKKAEFKVQTETKDADAEIAKAIQTQTRKIELNQQTGEAKAKETELANQVAKRENEIAQTEALRAVIEAEGVAKAEAARDEIAAEAQAKIAKIEADGIAEAAKRKAQGDADAVKHRAQGEADAIKLEADAEKDRISQVGSAEADIIKQKGLAEAEAIKAQGLARAEAEREMAEALAAQEGVNLKIELAKIEADARVEIMTNTSKIMSTLGTNAKFVNIGGDSSGGGKTGNVLLDTLAGIPKMLMMGDVKSDAMNDGSTFLDDLGGVMNSIMGRDGGVTNENLEAVKNLIGETGQRLEAAIPNIVAKPLPPTPPAPNASAINPTKRVNKETK